MVSGLIGIAPPLVLWTAVLARTRTLRRGRTECALWWTLVACAMAATLQVPAVGAWLAEITGLVNLLQVIKHVVVIAAAAGAREVIRGLALDRGTAITGAGRRYGFAAGAAVGLVVAFVASPITTQRLGGLTGGAIAEPSALRYVYWLIYLGFLGSVLVSIVRLCGWFGRNAAAGSLRTGLIVIGGGSAVGLVYVANKAALLLASLIWDLPNAVAEASTRLGTILVATSFVCLVVGIAIPAARHLPGPRHVRALIALRRLHPLWAALRDAHPHIVWTEDRQRVRLKDVEALLYDRVVEIQDGLLALRSAQLSAAEPLASIRDKDRAKALAAWVTAALMARSTGSPPPADVELPDDADLQDLVTLFAQVARAPLSAH